MEIIRAVIIKLDVCPFLFADAQEGCQLTFILCLRKSGQREDCRFGSNVQIIGSAIVIEHFVEFTVPIQYSGGTLEAAP